MVKSEKQPAAPTKSAAKTNAGSSAAQVAMLTDRIKELTAHLKANKKDFAARRGLLHLVGQRKRLLRYLARQDSQAYLELTERLGIRK